MEMLLSAKQYEIDAELRELADAAAAKLAERYNKLTSLRLVLSKERNWHVADAVLNGKNISLIAKARSTDMRVSVNNVAEKLDKQLMRYFQRIKSLATKPDPKTKDKIWTSEDLREEADDDDLRDGTGA
ncbi:MAG: ribosome-associated translation inhibitor RaiA [Lentisphaerae bacterium]|jgi:putative sigma-54 modulation protein|nr:ribosome-associated translation inhibitor RaiA [Lentisphaerota bacterium]